MSPQTPHLPSAWTRCFPSSEFRTSTNPGFGPQEDPGRDAQCFRWWTNAGVPCGSGAASTGARGRVVSRSRSARDGVAPLTIGQDARSSSAAGVSRASAESAASRRERERVTPATTSVCRRRRAASRPMSPEPIRRSRAVGCVCRKYDTGWLGRRAQLESRWRTGSVCGCRRLVRWDEIAAEHHPVAVPAFRPRTDVRGDRDGHHRGRAALLAGVDHTARAPSHARPPRQRIPSRSPATSYAV